MTALKVLFIGGSGVISSACSRRAVAVGLDLTVLNRGTTTTRALPDGVRVVRADVRDPASVRAALGTETFDVIADFIAFTPQHVQTDVDLFAGRTEQYVFISSASAYQKPSVGCRSSNRHHCATRTGSTRATRLPARSCSSVRIVLAGSRRPSCVRRIRTTRRRSR